MVGYSGFVPNAIAQAGIATTVAQSMWARARWARHRFYPELVDEPMHVILDRRHRAISGRPAFDA